MKKYLNHILLGILVFVAGYTVNKFELFSFFKADEAEITIINGVVKDFGTLNKGDVAVFYFKFKNTGDKDLKVSNIETKCGCTISDWNKGFLKPNQIDSIRVEYDTNIVGPFNRPISIYSNAKNNHEYVHIKGVVKD